MNVKATAIRTSLCTFVLGGTLLSSVIAAQTAHAQGSVHLQLFVGILASNPQAQQELYNQMISEFEKQNPGIQVSFETYNGASQELTTIETSVAAHQGPSIFDIGFLPTAYYTHGFHVLSNADWNAVGGRSKFFPKQFGEAGPTAKQDIGIPWEINPFALAYNKAMFKAAGIKSPPKTWTQFVQDAKKLTQPSKNQWGTGIDPADSLDPWHINWLMSMQWGSNFVDASKTKATLDAPGVSKALNFWFDWVTKFKIASPSDLDWKNTDLLSAFENGHIAMLPMQSMSMVPALKTSVIKNDWAFAPMPTIPYGEKTLPQGGIPVGTFISGDFLAIPKYVTGPQYTAALKWVKFFTSPAQQHEIFNVYGLLPSNVNAYNHDPALETSVVKSFIQTEKNAYPYPFVGAWGNVEVAFGGVANNIADEIATNTYKDGDIQKELQAANQQVQQALQH